MRLSFFQISCLCLPLWGSGCGGSAPSTDPSAPVISAVTLALQRIEDKDYVTLTASSPQDKTVVAYCFKTTEETPEASDTCFKPYKVQYIERPTASVLYHVWAKNSSGRISNPASQAVEPLAIASATLTRVSLTIHRLELSAPNALITSYCVTKQTEAPQPDDACFKYTPTYDIPTPDSPVSYRIYGQDSLGNVSPPLTRMLGACSEQGLMASSASVLPTVCVSTSLGEFVLELEQDKAPKSVQNFLKYVHDGYYSQTVFHRVISTFMVQGGGMAPDGTEKRPPYDPIELESPTTTGLRHVTGTVAMARTTEPNTATSQFFINVVDNAFLDGTTDKDGYAVFGRVISGMDRSVQAIRRVSVKQDGKENSSPDEPPVIYWAYQIK